MTSLDVIGKSILAGVAFRYVSFMLSGKHLKGMGSRNVTPSRGTPIHKLHSQIGNTDLRCNLLYLGIEEVKGETKRPPHQTNALNRGDGICCCLHYRAIQVGAIRNGLFLGGGRYYRYPYK